MKSVQPCWLLPCLLVASAAAQAPIDVTIPAGANFDHADFRFWTPPGAGSIRGVIVLMPGSNGDGRSSATDTTWQKYATGHHLALIAARITDKPHDQNFIEDYVDVRQGSGQALLDALSQCANQSKHPEVATAPLFLWGMSAGGEFNYEFVAWKPERVAAFVVNKGGIYYTALAPRAARDVPGILFIGGKDLESRVSTISGLYAVNHRAAALWALALEPEAAHIVGRSRDVAMTLYTAVLDARVGAAGQPMKPMTATAGWVGNFKEKTTQAFDARRFADPASVWLPSESVANAWKSMMTDTPFEAH